MKKTVSYILLIVFLSLYPSNTTAAYADNSIKAPEIHADSCILIDAVTGNVLYEKNADKKEYPASTTKIMTAGLALELGYYDKKTIVSQDALDRIGTNASNVALKSGEVLEYSDLLHMALISSANDAADVIAEGVGGDMILVMSRFVQEDPNIAELLTMIKLIKDLDSIPLNLRWDTFRVYKAGLISGRVDGAVGVDRNLTREEMVLMMNNYLKYTKDGSNLMHMVLNTDSPYFAAFC